MNDIPPKDRDIAMVFQNYRALPPHDRLGQPGFRAEAPALARARDRAAREGRREDSGPRRLSRPQTRESSPAASASGSRWAAPSSAAPQVFLLDEPLSNLDAKTRLQMRAEISRLHARLARP